MVRGPEEPADQKLKQFYDLLLAALRQPAVRNGEWQLLECVPAWEGNWTWGCFVAFAWQGVGLERLLVAINYAPSWSQCYVRLPFADMSNRQWRLQDRLSDAQYDRNGNELQGRGLYLDVAPWRYHVFDLKELL